MWDNVDLLAKSLLGTTTLPATHSARFGLERVEMAMCAYYHLSSRDRPFCVPSMPWYHQCQPIGVRFLGYFLNHME